MRGLQADHKVPLSRGGAQEIENWQALCNECNVVKRRACEGCNDDCQECAWAFPEKFGGSVRISLPSKLYARLKARSAGGSVKMEEIIVSILNDHVK